MLARAWLDVLNTVRVSSYPAGNPSRHIGQLCSLPPPLSSPPSSAPPPPPSPPLPDTPASISPPNPLSLFSPSFCGGVRLLSDVWPRCAGGSCLFITLFPPASSPSSPPLSFPPTLPDPGNDPLAQPWMDGWLSWRDSGCLLVGARWGVRSMSLLCPVLLDDAWPLF